MEFEAPAGDFSRLSVSNNAPPPPSHKLEPIDFSQLQHLGTVGYTIGRDCNNFDDFVGKVAHQHLIKINGNSFTVDDGPERDANHPDNIKFLESIKNYEIPEEFAEDGVHTIQVMRARKVPKYAIVDERMKECLKYMSF